MYSKNIFTLPLFIICFLFSSFSWSACPNGTSWLANKNFAGSLVTYTAEPENKIINKFVFQQKFSATGKDASASIHSPSNLSGIPYSVTITSFNRLTCIANVIADGQEGIFIFSNNGNLFDGLWLYPDGTIYKSEGHLQ